MFGRVAGHHSCLVDVVLEVLASLPAAIRFRLPDQPAYLDYVMTETNVAHAVRTGVPEREIRAWCAGTLANTFQGRLGRCCFGALLRGWRRSERSGAMVPNRVA